MNLFVFMGRLTGEPDIRYTKENKAVAKFTLAVDRRFQKGTADFFDCTAFGKTAEFVEKYLTKGTKVVATGSVQNNNYTNKEGKKIYGFAFMVESVEFAESKKAQEEKQEAPNDGWMNIPEANDDELPFV